MFSFLVFILFFSLLRLRYLSLTYTVGVSKQACILLTMMCNDEAVFKNNF